MLASIGIEAVSSCNRMADVAEIANFPRICNSHKNAFLREISRKRWLVISVPCGGISHFIWDPHMGCVSVGFGGGTHRWAVIVAVTIREKL